MDCGYVLGFSLTSLTYSPYTIITAIKKSYFPFLSFSVRVRFFLLLLQEEKLKGKPGYEHLNEPLHILIEAELPANVIDTRLRQAQEVMEELLKPVVSSSSVQ